MEGGNSKQEDANSSPATATTGKEKKEREREREREREVVKEELLCNSLILTVPLTL